MYALVLLWPRVVEPREGWAFNILKYYFKWPCVVWPSVVEPQEVGTCAGQVWSLMQLLY